MQLDAMQFKIRGMQRDITESSFSSEFAYENMNMSLISRDSNTLLALSTEKGNKIVDISDVDDNKITLKGDALGYAIVKDILIIFTHSTTLGDTIYKIYKESGVIKGVQLFNGNLNLDNEHPIETLSFYENEDIIKVYWTDSKNQLRFVNIVSSKVYTNTSFDTVQPLQLKEVVSIVKNDLSDGMFPSGTVQYAFTYYNQYAQETNIFYVSPLYYSTFKERGGTAEEKISNSFHINITNLDTKFDYLRIYSIIRTSIDSTPTVRKVTDISVKDNLTGIIDYTDTNTAGSTITPSDLLYVGGEELIIDNIAQKDNTLFIGNIKINRPTLQTLNITDRTITFSEKNLYYEESNNSFYGYKPEALRNRTFIDNVSTDAYSSQKSFKVRDTYRFGIQAQHTSGKWSETIWINDVLNTINPQTYIDSNGVVVKGSKAFYTINDSTLISTLIGLGYVRVRGVVVYPQLNDRSVIAQGILNPTLFNVGDRYNNSVDNIASWFSRPIVNGPVEPNINPINNGQWNEFRHGYGIPGWRSTNGEIQCNDGTPTQHYLGDVATTDFVSYYPSNFYIDQSVMTLNSPEIEFDDNIKNIENNNFKLRIIGLTNITGFNSNLSITTSTAPKQDVGGFRFNNLGIRNYSTYGYKSLITSPAWKDRIVRSKNDDYSATDHGRTIVDFMVYPWQAERSLNNEPVSVVNYSAKLASKLMSNLRYAGYNSYLESANIWTPTHGITDISVFNSTESVITKIGSPEEDNSKIVYKGNVDKIIMPNTNNTDYGKWSSFPITAAFNGVIDTINRGMSYDNSINDDELPLDYKIGYEPVRIQYKSTPHAIFGFKWNSGVQTIAPSLNGYNKVSTNSVNSFWRTDAYTMSQDDITIANSGKSGLWIAELYRDDEDIANRFGGQTQEAFEANTWLPCGEPISLFGTTGLPLTTLTVNYTEGDTFIQRYDCLKTYTAGLTNVNSVSEVVSFLCETHINLDSRTDKNRGNLDNTLDTPINFNLFNPVYNQRNNFFTYNALNYNRFNIDNFPNTISWTKSKIAGDLIDTWTNLTLANTLDLDGVYGSVNAIRNLNNELVVFQDKAIGTIQYNSRIQVNTSDGVPIEIANSAKVDGKRYATTTVGTRNKWSITQSDFGLYFIDNITKGIYLFNGNRPECLSDKLGFHSWSNNNITNEISWLPSTYNTFTSQYDKVNSIVYFINGDYCLGYSELMQQFLSFYSYKATPFMFNAFDTFLSLRRPFLTVPDGDTTLYLWEQNAGKYGEYFNFKQPFWVTVIANKDPHRTKVFNTISFRADTFDSNNVISDLKPFDMLNVWNEYQTGSNELTETANVKSTLKQKFRVWRATIPTDTSRRIGGNRPGSSHRRFGVDRMRNPWLYLSLIGSGQTENKTVLHDLVVNYTV